MISMSVHIIFVEVLAFGPGNLTNIICILQHPDLTVTCEERVLNAILIYCSQSKELNAWDRVDEKLLNSTPELIFGERLNSLDLFLSFVRFPLLPYEVLKLVCP